MRTGLIWEATLSNVAYAQNPYDPDSIQLNVRVTYPNGARRDLPAFWMQPYKSEMIGISHEELTPVGDPGWRFRFTPTLPGTYRFQPVVTQGQETALGTTRTATVTAHPAMGYLIRDPAAPSRLALSTGGPFVALGANFCWALAWGTVTYEEWIPQMGASGLNFVRLWMCPWFFGIEHGPGQLTRYAQDKAFQLDRVLAMCRANGIRTMVCLDYHGMLNTVPDVWGGNDIWKDNPYNVARGGPCATPADFFRNPAAKAAYKKRLRYLIARYGADPAVGVWEFWNELDNQWGTFVPAEAVAWHQEMASYLRTNDQNRRVISTSLSYRDWPELWQVPGIDLVQLHRYGALQPAFAFADQTVRERNRFGKPFLVGEFGVDWRGWSPQLDPQRRGFSQALWGPLVGGVQGTAMPWWWMEAGGAGLWARYRPMADLIRSVPGFGRADWQPRTATGTASTIDITQLGDPIPNAPLFSPNWMLEANWESQAPGRVVCISETAVGLQTDRINTFVHGAAHPSMKRPFEVDLVAGPEAKLELFVLSVATAGAELVARSNGQEVGRYPLPDRDGKNDVNNEYYEWRIVHLPEGRQTVRIENVGGDWAYVEQVRIRNLRPTTFRRVPGPMSALASGNGRDFVVYAVDSMYDWPRNATAETTIPCVGARVMVQGVQPGGYIIDWLRPSDGFRMARTWETTRTTNLILRPPTFSAEVVGRVRRTAPAIR